MGWWPKQHLEEHPEEGAPCPWSEATWVPPEGDRLTTSPSLHTAGELAGAAGRPGTPSRAA